MIKNIITNLFYKTNENNELCVVILAGGLGNRMQSTLPKVLHKIRGVPMITRIVREAIKLKPKKIVIVVGDYKDIIQKTLIETINSKNYKKLIKFALQPVALGTGDAVKHALEYIPKNNSKVLILNGDTPLLKYTTMKDILSYPNEIVISSIHVPEPYGYGRIIKNVNNIFNEIVEEKDCTEIQREISLVNVGIYSIAGKILHDLIPLIDNNNTQNEYYLTDIVKLYKKEYTQQIGLVILPNHKRIQVSGVNTKEQLEQLEKMCM